MIWIVRFATIGLMAFGVAASAVACPFCNSSTAKKEYFQFRLWLPPSGVRGSFPDSHWSADLDFFLAGVVVAKARSGSVIIPGDCYKRQQLGGDMNNAVTRRPLIAAGTSNFTRSVNMESKDILPVVMAAGFLVLWLFVLPRFGVTT